MDRNVVGVALDPQPACSDHQQGSDAIESGQSGRLDRYGVAVEKSELAKADDQTVCFSMQGNRMGSNFLLQSLLQFALQHREVGII